MLEPGRRGLVKQRIVPAFVHRSRRMSPARPRPAGRTNDEAPWLSLEFDFVGKFGLFQ